MAGRVDFSEDRRRKPATIAQVRAIYLIVAEEYPSWSASTLDRKCEERFGCKPLDLTVAQASQFIAALKGHV